MFYSRRKILASTIAVILSTGFYSLPLEAAQTKDNFNTPLTGDFEAVNNSNLKDEEYKNDGIIQQDGRTKNEFVGIYKFTKDTAISDNTAPININGGSVKKVVVDATDRTMTLKVNATDDANGIYLAPVGTENTDPDILLDWKAEKTLINIDATNATYGQINGIFTSSKAILDMKGLTEINIKGGGTSNGICAYGGKLTLEGLKIANNSQASSYLGMDLYGADVAVNIKNNNPSTATVDVTGNLQLDKTANLALALANKESKWEGVAKVESEKGKQGKISLFLQNGATWNHTAVDKKPPEDFAGSRITQFFGANDYTNTGIIYQKDENPLTIDNYSKYTTVVYEHDSSQKSPDDANGYLIKGGDLHIKKAVDDSSLTLLTDSTGLDLSSTDPDAQNLVNGTLNALAHKVYYENATEDTNLTGKVGIAQGLLSSGKAISIGGKNYQIPAYDDLKDITFDETTGQGQYEYSPATKPSGGQKKNVFTTPITGEKNQDEVDLDKEYVENGVKQIDDGIYKFTQDTTIQGNGDKFIAINQKGDSIIEIDATDKILTLTDVGQGIAIGQAGMQITAKKLLIKAQHNKQPAILIRGNQGGTLTITGNIEGEAIGNSNGKEAYGIHATKRTRINVKGDVTLRKTDGTSGISTIEGGTVAALFAGKNGVIDINGKFNATTDQYALVAKENARISVQGGEMLIPETDKFNRPLRAIESAGGTIAVNMNTRNTQATDEKVILKGNVALIAPKSEVYLGLSTKDSWWQGLVNIVDENNTKFNLHLQNGALWTNANHGNMLKKGSGEYSFLGSHVTKLVGGGADTSGFIYQKDANPLTIDNYSGNTIIFYKHDAQKPANEKDGYTILGGDTKITKAKDHSMLTLLTNHEGLDAASTTLGDKELLHATLNNLAHKLYYLNHADNQLKAQAGITEGILTSSKIITIENTKYAVPDASKLENITFNSTTGQGELTPAAPPPAPKEQDVTDINKTLQGDEKLDNYYIEHHIRQADGTYKFTKNTTITGDDTSNLPMSLSRSRGVKIDATDKTLTLQAHTPNSNATGIRTLQFGGEVNIKAKKLIIDAVCEGGTAGGSLQANAYGIMGNQNGTLNVEGMTEIKTDAQLRSYGIYNEEGHNTKYSFEGLKIATNKNAKDPVALFVQDGSEAYVNATSTGATNHVVELKGDILLVNNSCGATPKIHLALTTKDSLWQGISHIKDNKDMNEFAELNLYLQNFALFHNEKYGGKERENFAGSRITKLIGGTSKDTAGIIYQHDIKPLTLENYSGHTILFYKHETDRPSTMKDGYKMVGAETIINDATTDSTITLLTDGTDLNLTSTATNAEQNLVNGTLNSLAHKLYYKKYATGNLTAKVGIAEGILSSSAAKNITIEGKDYQIPIAEDLKTVEWETTGQGKYIFTVKPETTPPPPVTPKQKNTEFTSTMYADKDASKPYVDNNVMLKDGKYHFDKPTTITLENKNGASFDDEGSSSVIEVHAEKDLTFNLTGKGTPNPLHPNDPSKNTYKPVTGIEVTSKKTTTITAPKLNINATGEDGVVTGISLTQGVTGGATLKNWQATLNIKGDVNLNIKGHKKINGIYTVSNSKLTVDGNVNAMGDSATPYGIFSAKGGDTANASNFLYAGSNYHIQTGAKLKVTGDIHAKARANGLYANGGHAKITVLGGGYLEIDPASNFDYYALRAESGTVNLNVNLNPDGSLKSANNKDLVVKGNIGTLTTAVHPDEPETWSKVNVAFATKDSEFNGVAFNQFSDQGQATGGKTVYGAINLFLKNKASWIHDVWGKNSEFQGTSKIHTFTGGEDDNKKGYIYQTKAKNNISIDEYSGHTAIFYNHKLIRPTEMTKGYEVIGGNFTINKAKTDSHITLVTDNQGLDLASQEADEQNLISGTLNNLAHKLYYLAHQTGEKNLTAKVGIAEGILDSSKLKTINLSNDLKKVDFEDNGQGKYIFTPIKKKNPGTGTTPGTTPSAPKNMGIQITGDKDKDKKYLDDGILKKEGEGVYSLQHDNVNISVKGMPAIIHEKDFSIKGEDKTFGIENINTTVEEKQYGIKSDTKGTMQIAVKKLNVTVKNSKDTETVGIRAGRMGSSEKGIVDIKGEVDIKTEGKNNVHGIYVQGKDEVKVEGNLNIDTKAETGTFATGIYTENKDAMVEVGGTVNLKVNGTGILATDDSKINIKGGGTVKITENNKKSHYALKAENSTVSFHYEDQGKNLSKADVKIHGNIGVLSDKERSANDKKAQLSLGLNTENSTLTGVAYNEFAENEKEGGKITLRLENNAKWNNQKVGKTNDKFTGSRIYALTSDNKGGHIYQKDDKPIYIENISGKHTIHLDHENKGTEKKDYKAGDIYLKKAAKDTEIILVTKNDGASAADLDKKEEAYQFFNTIANKLYYTGEDGKLQGTVITEEGILAPAKKLMRNITFDKNKDGQGMIVKENEKLQPSLPKIDEKNKLQYQDGDYETSVMKGTRTSMLSASIFWTNHNNDALRRLGDLRLAKEESGIWTKYQGGETNFDGEDNSGKEVNISQKYNLIQVGYDKKIGDFTLGAVIDHGSASDTYLGKADKLIHEGQNLVLTGTGKIHMTGISLYANRIAKDGSYLDIIGKIGQVKSDYDVRTNPAYDSIHGNYKTMAYSLSGEYGKRMYQKDGFYYEPSVELTLSKVGDKDYSAYSTRGTKLDIRQQGIASTIGRFGISLGKESARGHYFLKLALAHEFSGDIKTDFSITDMHNGKLRTTAKEIKLDLADTWLDLEVGTSYKMSDNSYFYGTFTKNFGAKLDNKWRLDAGLRFAL